MALINKKIVDPKFFDICRCCLKNRCSEDISSETDFFGHKEVYEDMLRKTFNIEISHQKCCGLTASRHICEECIKDLRKAAEYKEMVRKTEEGFADYIKNLLQTVKKEGDSNNYHTDVMKLDESEEAAHDDKSVNSSTDDEVLADVKISLTKKRGISNEKVAKNQEHRKTKNEVKLLAQNEVERIVERRGNGPILRRNSLLLLSNSTLCVFQWNQSRYRCFCCQEPFYDIDALREHNNTHNIESIEKKIIAQQNKLVKVEVSNIYCKLCNEAIDNLNVLLTHLSSEHDVTFNSKDHLLVPFRLQNGDLKCQLCSEGFRVFRLLNIHMNKHYQKHVCHVCGAGFSNLVFLNLHKSRSHRPFKCRLCEITFISKMEKKKHELYIHDIKYERKLRFPCSYCSERFSQENFRVLHLVEKHGLAKPDHHCNMCSKTFVTQSLLNSHVKNVHKKEKNHQCDICHYLFYTKSDLTRHKVVHTREKNYCCHVCKHNFAAKDSLRRHLKRAHGLHSNIKVEIKSIV